MSVKTVSSRRITQEEISGAYESVIAHGITCRNADKRIAVAVRVGDGYPQWFRYQDEKEVRDKQMLGEVICWYNNDRPTL